MEVTRQYIKATLKFICYCLIALMNNNFTQKILATFILSIYFTHYYSTLTFSTYRDHNTIAQRSLYGNIPATVTQVYTQ